MADFCKECSELMFDRDYGDLETSEFFGSTDFRCKTICENCGWIIVDAHGVCQNHSYQEHHDIVYHNVWPKE